MPRNLLTLRGASQLGPEERALIRAAMAESQKITISEQALHVMSRPMDVAYVRREMVDWWSVSGIWQHRYAMQGRRPIKGFKSGLREEAEGARWWIENSLRDAELYWVSPEMTEVIETLAPSIPDCLPQPPCQSGFVVFGKAVSGTDAQNGGLIYTTAFLWAPVTTVLGECISIETYAHKDVLAVWLQMSAKEREDFHEIMPLKLHPTGGSEWPLQSEISDFSLLGAEDGDQEASMKEDRRLLATFWALCSQKITVEDRWEPDRRLRRQFERHKGYHIPPAVRVIRLREPTARTQGAGEGEVEWSHRWIVGSHWRRQWHPSTGQHVPTLIEAFVKGPKDKPLVVRQTVKALVR